MIEELKALLPDLIAKHGPQPQTRRGDNIRGPKKKFSYTISKGVFQDFETGESGGVFEVLVYLKLAPNREAAVKYAAWLVNAGKRPEKPFAWRCRNCGSYDTWGITYLYTDEYEALRYIKQRFDCDNCGEKSFSAGRVVNGKIKIGMNGACHLPYRVAEWYASSNDVVYLAEGEKAADILRLRYHKQATSVEKWTPEIVGYFQGFKVFIVADRDKAGLEKARAAKAALDACGVQNKIITHADETNDIADGAIAHRDAQSIYWEKPHGKYKAAS